MHAVRTSYRPVTQQTRHVETMVLQCWARVVSAENPANTKHVHGTYTTLVQRRSGTTSSTLVQHCTDATQMSYDCRENM